MSADDEEHSESELKHTLNQEKLIAAYLPKN
jgi:hypothetical protein